LAISNEKIANLSDKLKVSEEKQFGESEQYSINLSAMKVSMNKEKEQLK
jgi:hypothetical protein